VFDGARGHYDEADPPAPIFSYGRQKAEAERLLQTTCDDYLLLRLAMVCGSEPRDGTLLVDWAERLRAGTPIACAVDFGGSPIYVDDVVDSILALIRGGCRGVYHVAGERSYSRSELLDLLLAEAARHGCPCVSPIKRCSIDDFGLPEPRPHDISMRPAKCIAATGVRPRSMESVCRQIGDWAFSAQQQRTSTANAGGAA
jgi:dTDP-4-dehydrorhamnose reductase